MSYLPDRHSPTNADMFDFLSDYQKGILDGFDFVIYDDQNYLSLIGQAMDYISDDLTGLNKTAFDAIRDLVTIKMEKYIDSYANKVFVAMYEGNNDNVLSEKACGPKCVF